MLLNMDQVLRREGVRYFLNYGSLIGAVREKGALPYARGMTI
jgi:phosphorylcholine metabolism protein LicD